MTDAVELRAREIIRDHVAATQRDPHMTWEEALAQAQQELAPPMPDNPIYISQHEGQRQAVIPLSEDVRPQSLDYLAQILGMWDLHVKKAAGYSGHSPDVWANFRTNEALGVPDEMGVYIRMNDKFNRLKSLVQNPDRDMVNEPIEDLLQDIAAYAMIARCLRSEVYKVETIVEEVES